MKVPTIKIRNPKTGETRKVNVSDWKSDLGCHRFAGWTARSDEQNVGTDPKAPTPEKTVHEVGTVVEEKEPEPTPEISQQDSRGNRRPPRRRTNA